MSFEYTCIVQDGRRDCGRFFLDIIGQYTRDDLRITWTAAPFQPHESVRRMIEETWTRQTEQATQQQRMLFNGPLCRLIDFDADEKHFTMTVGPVGYKEFLGTNLTQASIRYVYGPKELANPLGVSAAVVTEDGFVALGMRSSAVAFHAGRIHPVGGMVEPAADPSMPPDPFAAIVHELRAELAVQDDQIIQNICMGMIRDKQIVQPELVFDVQLSVDAPTLRAMAAKAPEANEHDEIVLVANFPSTIVTFLQKQANTLTPVAIATLLLHGLRNWGSGWFTSARGYLQSVI